MGADRLLPTLLLLLASCGSAQASRWVDLGTAGVTMDKVLVDLDSVRKVDNLRTADIMTLYAAPRENAPVPNDSGTYRFVDSETVVCTNAAGQTATWKRTAKPQQPSAAAAAQASNQAPAQPASTTVSRK
jgi:hypothetical protein